MQQFYERSHQFPFDGQRGAAPFALQPPSLQYNPSIKSDPFLTPDMEFISDDLLTALFDDRDVLGLGASAGASQFGSHPYLPPQSISEPTSPLPALDHSPQSEWTATPQTLYKSSPMTEYADEDVVVPSDDDEDGSEEANLHRRTRVFHDPLGTLSQKDLVVPQGSGSTAGLPQFTFQSPNNGVGPTSPTAYTLGDLPKVASPSLVQVTPFRQQLQNDIRTAKLFPGSPPHRGHVIPPFSSVPQSPARSIRADVTPLSAPTRKPSLHLNPPAQPINPFQRVPLSKPLPVQQFAAPVISPVHLRRYRIAVPTTEGTVAPKDLFMPNSEFLCGYDPEVMLSEMLAPADLIQMKQEYDAYAEEQDLQEQETIQAVGPSSSPIGPIYRRQRLSSEPSSITTTRAGTKRAAPVDDDDDDDSSSTDNDEEYEDAAGEEEQDDDDGDFRPSSSIRASIDSQHPTKRQRLASPSPSAPAPTRKVPYQAITKPRTRHLQPNLVRTHPCRYGCDLLFSTAYESRRHQEDAHGREEAYALISRPKEDLSQIRPKEYRYLIEIALHAAGDKWDGKTKGAFMASIERRAEEPFEEHLATTLIKFAREWVKRYECPRCGTSFSRLDSRKRHFEKQCR